MDIQVISTKKIFYQIDNAIAAMLMEAFPKSFKRVVPQPKPESAAPAPATPVWGVGRDAGGYFHIFYRLGAHRGMYVGPPDNAVNGFKTRRWSGQTQTYVLEGPEPPLEVVAQYRKEWTQRPPLNYAGPQD